MIINNLNSNEKWNQWFAGLTDGDGCFYINKKENSVSFEITTHTIDARVLYNVKNKLKAGTVKLRSNSNSVRYRVKKKSIICEIINRLNGKIQNPARIAQFKEACRLCNIDYVTPSAVISNNDAYLSGLIDSDGTFAISVSNSSTENSQLSGVAGKIIRLTKAKGFCQISLKITSSHKIYLDMIKTSYGYGFVYVEKPDKKKKRPNYKYHWTIKSCEDFERLFEYIKKNPLKSVKMHRMRLSLLYFKYKNLNYHLKPADTIESKMWTKFSQAWFKYSS